MKIMKLYFQNCGLSYVELIGKLIILTVKYNTTKKMNTERFYVYNSINI